MRGEPTRESAHARISASIKTNGYHVYVVAGGPAPRCIYTIGLSLLVGSEVILAGASDIPGDDALEVVRECAALLRQGREARSVVVQNTREFALGYVDRSWSTGLLLGAYDYLDVKELEVLQLIPGEDQRAVDVPDMSKPIGAESSAIWGLSKDWSLPFPPQSRAVTNVDALLGYAITEVARWEDDEWEMFSGSGPEVDPDDIRSVPLSVLTAFDPSLLACVQLKVGEGMWREDATRTWKDWKKRS